MNATQNLEQRIADFYATEPPTRAPDWLLARALDTIDTTPQQRTGLGRPWRFPPMTSFAKLAVGAVAIVTISVIGATVLRPTWVGPAATASPGPSSLPSALPPPLTERFDSTLNGISIDYPAGWQTRPATELWTDGVLSFGASGVDIIFDPTRPEDLYLAMASEPLRGRSDDVWAGDLTLPWCPGGHGGSVLTFDGASGWVVSCGGSPVGRQSALLVTDTRGYAFVLYLGDEGLADTYGDRWFVSLLETVDLRAEDAPDASNPSESP